ncbi:MAG: hypothetical protein AMXMBFR84_40460 [Candidatus Hydrogenedentota bacterium]
MTGRFFLLLILLAAANVPAMAQPEGDRDTVRQERERPQIPEPDYPNVSYGPHERNVFDIWLAKSEKPTPLVIHYHGGGFRGGDKRSINPALLKTLLANGITVAAVNYRLTDTAIYPAQMLDCARALQFIRYHAKDYNVDPSRVGATGGSAGSGISQWLAFHDDLADSKSDDPIARESTRLKCVAVFAAQTSYDPRFIQSMFNTNRVHSALVTFFGMASEEDLNNPQCIPLFEDSSALTHISADDPPLLLFYPQANTPLPINSTGEQHIHHPKFGEVMRSRMKSLNVECVVKFREDYPDIETNKAAPWLDMASFLTVKLGSE